MLANLSSLANTSDNKLIKYFLFFPENRIFPMETICMKCQNSVFLREIRKIF